MPGKWVGCSLIVHSFFLSILLSSQEPTIFSACSSLSNIGILCFPLENMFLIPSRPACCYFSIPNFHCSLKTSTQALPPLPAFLWSLSLPTPVRLGLQSFGYQATILGFSSVVFMLLLLRTLPGFVLPFCQFRSGLHCRCDKFTFQLQEKPPISLVSLILLYCCKTWCQVIRKFPMCFSLFYHVRAVLYIALSRG